MSDVSERLIKMHVRWSEPQVLYLEGGKKDRFALCLRTTA